ncbi:MAG: hypothetical protein COA41_01330 [Sphingopyxis sp.]|nr:MAG: hypothetical protein COA41_01330 [Sphingopyxis sp.]
MLILRSKLEAHRLVVAISVSRHSFGNEQLYPATIANPISLAEYRGLIDTGATRSVISEKIIIEQKLMRTGHMQFGSMHDTKTHTKYIASIGFWAERKDAAHCLDENDKTFFLHNQLIEPVNMNNNAKFEAIIGFDILKHYDFSFDKNQNSFEILLNN